ncbi:hypothetical protein KAW80_04195 [Candidatus Babeliales bacterium]|nr:hypothetical protein [Candidatus Babeliales bacterium]
MNHKSKTLIFTIILVTIMSGYHLKIIPDIGTPREAAEEIANYVAKEFEKLIDKANRKLEALKELPQKFKDGISSAGYYDSKISILTTEGDGIELNFGFGGHGSLLGFEKKKAEFKLKDLPKEWGAAIGRTLEDAGLEKLINFSKGQIGFLKIALLCQDRKRQVLDKEDFVLELSFLLYRFLITGGFDNPSDILKDIFQPLETLIKAIRIKGSSAGVFLDDQFSKVKKFAAMKFHKKVINGEFVKDQFPAYKENLTDGELRTILFGLIFKTYIFYVMLQDKFHETSSGKTALEDKHKAYSEAAKLGNIARRKASRLVALNAYNSKLPKLNDLKKFVAVEIARILNKYSKSRDLIAKTLDPLLKAILGGIDSECLLESFTGEPEPESSLPPEEPEETLDNDFDVDEV